MQEIRCLKCGKLLAKASKNIMELLVNPFEGHMEKQNSELVIIEIKCPRCGEINKKP